MNLHDDDFTLFDLPRRQALDVAALDQRWKALQGEVHPDRFVAQGAAALRVAMQWAVRVNEAYRRLKQPLSRAAYLCELHGAPIEAENNTAMPADFLMRQMAWREALDEAVTLADVQTLADEVAAEDARLHADLAERIDLHADWPGAAARVRALMFVARFAADVDRRLDALEP
ncbi:Fe-S protein assembly co-chaperone HscB [Sphaerotilus mobilis]|uniref:Co-chaperone protein HscB homolog n=1 Tax=Sphaerotilus mobilis TaxID=47994 RepID=A0A4Q7LDI0_9BURK|nr:Fe-S protein assembly co-chaperone HscB [Sphaerotilus mobilis]RZS52052.1 molecular chaperone HscB [Sphaerotilus mobilis]